MASRWFQLLIASSHHKKVGHRHYQIDTRHARSFGTQLALAMGLQQPDSRQCSMCMAAQGESVSCSLLVSQSSKRFSKQGSLYSMYTRPCFTRRFAQLSMLMLPYGSCSPFLLQKSTVTTRALFMVVPGIFWPVIIVPS
jgi:hypothetical protein